MRTLEARHTDGQSGLDGLGALSRVATVYVVSGRDAVTLERWLGQLRIGLVAEHGLELRPPGAPWQQLVDVSGRHAGSARSTRVRRVTRLTPGSGVETKSAALTWHYRAADPEHGHAQALALALCLRALLDGHPYAILPGKCVVEVRHEHVTNGHALVHLLARSPAADCLLCAGDDRTDEDLLRAIPESWKPRAVTAGLAVPTRGPPTSRSRPRRCSANSSRSSPSGKPQASRHFIGMQNEIIGDG